MYKVLVVGCGNIGAQYDFNSSEIQTHVKAWYLNPLTDVSIFDLNPALAVQVSKEYSCEIVADASVKTLAAFDVVSICTPTFTHYQLLNDALKAKVKTIICEKPISNDRNEMLKLKKAYLKGESKILVNYIRRFQPAFIALSAFIKSTLGDEKLTNINIRYQRGFINNCSHAFDLLEFLFQRKIDLTNIKMHNKSFDQFEGDPTLSLQAFWGNVNLNVMGLSDVLYSHFEIDLYFSMYKISITNAGGTILIYKSQGKEAFLLPLVLQETMSKQECLKNYMKFVIDHALMLNVDRNLEDNFLASIDLNLKMLNYKNK